MALFNPNIKDIFYNLIPSFLRKDIFQRFMYSCAAGLNVTKANLFELTNRITLFLRFNSQTIVLERYLNDNFDPIQRRIFITNTMSGIDYLFNKAEQQAPVYYYNKWDSTNSYSIDQYTVYLNKVYQSEQNANLNKVPSSEPTWWEDLSEEVIFFENSGETSISFFVNVPGSLTFDTNEMTAGINQYKTAGKTFEIITF